MNNRILIVDDEPANLVLLEAILSQLNNEIVCARSGPEALELLETSPVDIMLLDLMMPGMDGLELLHRVRARTDWAWFPAILVTAANEREARLRGFEAGADEFLEKPVDRALLLTRVRTLLRLREAQERLEERARKLEELHHARRELVNLIVHDLKNPLGVIHTNLRYIETVAVPGSPSFHEALQDATVASERMNGLILDILSVERMELSELPLIRQELNVATLVAEVTRAHQREAEMQRLHLVDTRQDANVRADPSLLRRVLENLVENAIRHTPPEGNVEIAVEPGPDVGVVVSNTGTPIPAEIRATLFDKYVSGAKSTSRFGLGLYFCHRVAIAHSGTLSLVERAGWPVSFRFALPAA